VWDSFRLLDGALVPFYPEKPGKPCRVAPPARATVAELSAGWQPPPTISLWPQWWNTPRGEVVVYLAEGESVTSEQVESAIDPPPEVLPDPGAFLEVTFFDGKAPPLVIPIFDRSAPGSIGQILSAGKRVRRRLARQGLQGRRGARRIGPSYGSRCPTPA
jgi:hypothetical protein